MLFSLIRAVILESYIKESKDYVIPPEEVDGPIPWPVDPAYIQENALGQLESVVLSINIRCWYFGTHVV
jgi:hypothetical protein